MLLPSAKYLSKKIESVQSRAGKLPARVNNIVYGDRLFKLNLPSLKYMRRDLLQCLKILHNIGKIKNEIDCLNCGKSCMFQIEGYNSTRGHQMKLKI